MLFLKSLRPIVELSAYVSLLFLSTGLAQRRSVPQDHDATPSLVLRGTISASQNNSYVEVPFTVPPGTERVTLAFSYTGKDQRTTLDLGMLDSEQLRCWSGGNKSELTVRVADATPSCLPGPISPGRWRVLIGVPNIRAGQTSTYTANVYFTRNELVANQPAALRTPVRSEPAWYRGDLHMHTAHSDGSCTSLGGAKVPCPVFVTLEAAAHRGLDFIAVTDHNTTSHYAAMRELAPYFDTVLLIPGREITTFHGHFNLLGTEDFLDFRLGSKEVPDMNSLLRSASMLGGVISINHPNAPTGEVCMGCGWTPNPPAELSLVQAVEAVNAGAEEGPYSGLSFWERQLNQGFRLTAVGGSDNHTPQRPLDQVGSVGSPTTVVHATALSTPEILGAIRAGHVFVDLTATRDRLLEMRAKSGEQLASMGDVLDAAPEADVTFQMHTEDVDGASLVLIEDSNPVTGLTGGKLSGPEQSTEFHWKSDGKRHWFRADVRGPDGKLWLLGNPIYINWPLPDHKLVSKQMPLRKGAGQGR